MIHGEMIIILRTHKYNTSMFKKEFFFFSKRNFLEKQNINKMSPEFSGDRDTSLNKKCEHWFK